VCAAPLREGWALSAQTDWDTLNKRSSQAEGEKARGEREREREIEIGGVITSG